ncbi:hypothetical protein AOQ84DRAFT_437047 [Glonium stellatum]|uniref:Uncharacterized protein n=1 Tax=Glonium stellatum TaxID=574774 RepID=A0A8E2F863_9PEZI|nr:hypothetical protein AOQ84DRAFT_437047 [Glonium stellatum]
MDPSSIELISRDPLARQPSLEAQPGTTRPTRHWWRREPKDTTDYDSFEQIVEDKVSKLWNEQNLEASRDIVKHIKKVNDLRRNYRRLKLQKGGTILKCLVWVKDFPIPRPDPSTTCSEPESFQFNTDSTYFVCLQQLSGYLGGDNSGDFRLCLLATEPDENHLDQAFTFYHKLFASFGGRLDRLKDTPRWLVATVIVHEWGLGPEIENLLPRERGTERSTWSLEVPSKKSQPPPLNLQAPDGRHIALTWQYHAPRYQGDIDSWVWERYSQSPSFQYADAFIISPYRMLVSLKSSEMVQSFCLSRCNDAMFEPLSSRSQRWSTTCELLLSIITLFTQMATETGVFINEATREINAMKYEGRLRPSVSKVRYLIHLSDCRQLSEQGITHGLLEISSLSTAIMDAGKVVPLWEEGVPFLERLESVKVDLLYLKSELLGISEKIDGLQRMIYEQLRLSQDERNFILTILAVLFVPLSFLSGFFGMNIRIPKPSDFSGLSKFMNDSLTNLTLPEHNRSAALIAGIDSSGVQTWDMKSYWIAAVPLVLTVPLFLIAGGAVRWAIQSATKYAAYWRISTFIVGSILFLFVYVAMPILWTWRA